MKKLNISILIAALICIFSLIGCEDYLDKPIEGQIPTEDIDYTNLSMMRYPVEGVYGSCRSTRLIGWDVRAVDLYRSDQAVKGGKVDDQPAMEAVLEKYQYNNTEWFVNNPWGTFYGVINECETALDELDKFREYCTSSGDLALNDQYKAEVRFWRAMGYWRVARYYGDICWFDKEIPSIDLRLSPREEAYAWIIGEIKDLREDLPTEHPNKHALKGIVTRWAADMLLAKAAADVQDYATMEQAAGEIVNSGLFSLHPDYYELFTVNQKLCDENILELQYYYYNEDNTYTHDDAYYNSMAMATRIYGLVPRIGSDPPNYRYSGGWGFVFPSQTYYDRMVSRGDTVRLKRCLIAPKSYTPKGDSVGAFNANTEALYAHYIDENLPNGVARFYFFKDFCESVDRTVQSGKYGGYNNIRIFRYADALLLYAEALVHNNGPGAGDQYVNLVRARAGLPPWSGATIDQIIDERGIELSQEWGGDRFFDLVRTGKTNLLGSNFTPGEDEFFLTPQSQIDIHPGLVEPPVSGLFPTTFGD